MFDISWSEFLLIGVVALIVIGPKELPTVMRTLGQWTRKVRAMAADFQNQFQEVMREAEMADLKNEVDDLAHQVRNADPIKSVRDDFQTMGSDFEHALDQSHEQGSPADETAPELTMRSVEPQPEPVETANPDTATATTETAAAETAKPRPTEGDDGAAAAAEPVDTQEPANATERTG